MIIDLTKAKLIGAEVSSVLALGYRLTDKPGAPVMENLSPGTEGLTVGRGGAVVGAKAVLDLLNKGKQRRLTFN